MIFRSTYLRFSIALFTFFCFQLSLAMKQAQSSSSDIERRPASFFPSEKYKIYQQNAKPLKTCCPSIDTSRKDNQTIQQVMEQAISKSNNSNETFILDLYNMTSELAQEWINVWVKSYRSKNPIYLLANKETEKYTNQRIEEERQELLKNYLMNQLWPNDKIGGIPKKIVFTEDGTKLPSKIRSENLDIIDAENVKLENISLLMTEVAKLTASPKSPKAVIINAHELYGEKLTSLFFHYQNLLAPENVYIRLLINEKQKENLAKLYNRQLYPSDLIKVRNWLNDSSNNSFINNNIQIVYHTQQQQKNYEKRAEDLQSLYIKYLQNTFDTSDLRRDCAYSYDYQNLSSLLSADWGSDQSSERNVIISDCSSLTTQQITKLKQNLESKKLIPNNWVIVLIAPESKKPAPAKPQSLLSKVSISNNFNKNGDSKTKYLSVTLEADSEGGGLRKGVNSLLQAQNNQKKQLIKQRYQHLATLAKGEIKINATADRTRSKDSTNPMDASIERGAD